LAHPRHIFDRYRGGRKTRHGTALGAEFRPPVCNYCCVHTARIPIFSFVNVAPVNGSVSIIGIILCAAGMAFLVWTRIVLGRNWSQTVSVKEGHELVMSGPYRYVRHATCTGGLVACIGSAVVCGGAWIFLLVVLGVLFLWRAGAEDKLMVRQFSNEYPDYKRRTKALILFVW
jgi:protein-S-isoprenylcysteine O-methyltransferase Ste14